MRRASFFLYQVLGWSRPLEPVNQKKRPEDGAFSKTEPCKQILGSNDFSVSRLLADVHMIPQVFA